MAENPQAASRKRIVILAAEILLIAAFAFISLARVSTCPKCRGDGAWVHYHEVTEGGFPGQYRRHAFPGQCEACGGFGKIPFMRKWTWTEKKLAPAVPPQEGKQS
jgi:hypothetical protein